MLSIVISAGISVLAFNVATQVDEGITSNAGYYSVIVGPAGSQTQLAMNTMYFTDAPLGTIPYSVVTSLEQNSRVTAAVPFAMADNYNGYGVVGTTSRFLSGKEVDADYTILQAEELSENMALWQKIAESGIITDVYAMYDYVNFLCAWNTYYVDNSTDENGNTVPGYYLYPSDAEHYIYTDGAQWNYGYQEGYFEDIIRRIQAVDATAFQDLVDNVMQAQALAEEALAELENQNYTSEYQYVEAFGREDYVYTLDRGDELAEKMQALYTDFSNWLGSWEM